MIILKMPLVMEGMNEDDGCKLAPDKILKEIETNPISEEMRTLHYEVDSVNDFFDIEHKIKGIKENAVILGGDHSITYDCLKAFSESNEDAGLVMIDAHPDCRIQVAGQKDLVSSIVYNNVIKKENIILFGVRSYTQEEIDFLKEHNILVYSMKEISFEGLQECVDAMMSAARKFGSLYISIDVDAIDPSSAPGVGGKEPGGFTAREIIYIAQRLRNMKNFRIADITEVNPRHDVDSITVKLAAKIAKELM